MANPCYNNVSFEGDEKQIRKLLEAYEKTNEVRATLNGGTLHFILFDDNVVVDNYMDYIYIEDINGETMSFITPWAPDPVQLIRVAKMFGVSFVLEYEELSCNIYGEFRYDHVTDELSDRCCTDQECEEADQKEETFDILDKILQTKDWNPCTYDLSDGTYEIHDRLKPKDVT